MLNDITLGQYFPGNSIMHRLDPRVKIIITILYITAIFCVDGFYTLGMIVICDVLLVLFSGIPVKTVLKSFKPLVFIIIFTFIINIFMTGDGELLFQFFFIKIYADGVRYAVFILIRLLSLVTAASVLLTYTTSPSSLTDAIESLLSPLKRIKVPVHEFAMMMTIALRFIPTLIDETQKIINAQKARGADFVSGDLIKRAKALIPILLPLIISAFRRAEELATAMECRCYRGGEGRTKMKKFSVKPRDFGAFFLAAGFMAGIIVLQMYI